MERRHRYLRLKYYAIECLLATFKPVFRVFYHLETLRRKLHIYLGATTRVVERPYEYAFVLYNLPYGNNVCVLDVGTGSTAMGALLKGCNYVVDCLENTSYRQGRLPLNSHCNLIRGDVTSDMLSENCYDAVTCISVLEHIEEYNQAIENMVRVLKPGGVLILTIPYNEHQLLPDSYKHKKSNRYSSSVAYPCNIYSAREVQHWCAITGASVEQKVVTRWWTGPFWNSGERLPHFLEVSKDQPHDHACILFKKPGYTSQ